MPHSHGSRAVPIGLLAASLLAPVLAFAQKPDGAVAAGVVARRCAGCHGGQKPQGGLDLSGLKGVRLQEGTLPLWRKTAEKLRTGEMPPPGSPRPSATEIRAVVEWVETETRRLEAARPPDPGRVTVRRLNRVEYRNTIRDLLDVDFVGAEDFPQDDSGYGFDNIGDVLSLSPALMERYLAAAETIARAAILGPEPIKPYVVQHRPAERRFEFNRLIPPDYDTTGLCLPNSIHVSHTFPVDGEYVVRAVLRGARPRGSEPLPIAIWLDGVMIESTTLEPKGASFYTDRQDFSGKYREFRIRTSSGRRLLSVTLPRYYEGLPAKFGGPRPARPELLPPDTGRPRRSDEELPINEARLGHLEVTGPYVSPAQAGPRFLKCHAPGRHEEACARATVESLSRQAFRRPLRTGETERYLALHRQAMAAGDTFEEALCTAVQAILVSPHFLFRWEAGVPAEPAQPAAKPASVVPLSDHALASRLSYFLWSRPPDAELARLADTGELRKPNVLDSQMQRMLQDPRADALAEHFGGQWLELRKLDAIRPDRERFPEFEEYLRYSMRRETELFFSHLLRSNGPVTDLVAAEYTFANERLARFYDLPDVRGPEFRRVPQNPRRGSGLLSQASILALSSYSTRTSPVLRGRWILENLLDSAPPPPPPGVPNLDESKLGESVSLKRQLEIHRTNPTCASCHSRMDPLGFALENFDAIGGWRTMDGKLPVDSDASLPDGRRFRGPRELSAVLAGEKAELTRSVATRLLIYAMGRGLEPYDAQTVRRIVEQTERDGFKLSRMVRAIAESLPFRMKRGTKS